MAHWYGLPHDATPTSTTFEADYSKDPYGDFDYERQKRLRGTVGGGRSWGNIMPNTMRRLGGLLEGPVGDKDYRQPPRLDWEETLPSFLPNEVGMDWPLINLHRLRKRKNLPDVEEWDPSNNYQIRVIR